MKFPLFRRGAKPSQELAQAQVEKLLAESLRVLGQLFTRTAELIEAQRLERRGYGTQDRFLERIPEEVEPKKS